MIAVFFCVFSILFTSFVQADGKVISKDCPFNCKIAGIKKKYCREWKDKDKCYIEDNSPRVYIEKRNCPYSCKTLNLPARECKDYKEGNLCVVERLVGLKF